jgi:hypothetical protein
MYMAIIMASAWNVSTYPTTEDQMSFFDRLFGSRKELKIPEQPMFTSTTVTETKISKPRKPRAKKPQPEPVVEKPVQPEVKVIKMDFDPTDPRQGSMELEWNDQFIQLLRQHGYTGDSEEALIDAWLNDICRNIIGQPAVGTVPEYSRFVRRQDLGDGKTEVS